MGQEDSVDRRQRTERDAGVDAYCRFIQETTPAQREKLLEERMKRRGLVRWARFPHIWVTPERAKELDDQYLENMRSRMKPDGGRG